MMPSDALILETVEQAFAECPRPEHFTDYTHCEECAEHDDLLRSRDVRTLLVEDVGNPGSDPICFVTAQAFAYYLPALVRLALAEPTVSYGWYGAQLLFHLCGDGHENRRVLACTPNQRRAIAEFLRHLVETRAVLADSERCTEELFQALDIWSDEIRVA